MIYEEVSATKHLIFLTDKVHAPEWLPPCVVCVVAIWLHKGRRFSRPDRSGTFGGPGRKLGSSCRLSPMRMLPSFSGATSSAAHLYMFSRVGDLAQAASQH
jgi:hypothetical protein